MMAMLFSQRVILGKCTFEQVPKKLQKQVAEILVEECGMPELVPAEYGGTKDVEAK
ncbi:MAG: CD1375 family protein [Agathobaculum butyriciproducens]|nr:CD1375 family protein [Agathobaculum butyriciproducens]